jgi:plastocyanin
MTRGFVIGVCICVATSGFVLTGCGGRTASAVETQQIVATSADYDYIIPAGAGALADAGTPLSLFPTNLAVTIGETIRIVNDDERGHTIGPFFVGAHQTLTQRFTAAGEFTGTCSVHPDSDFVLVVAP